MGSTGTVVGITGNMLTARIDGPVAQNEVGVVTCGATPLRAEVIRVDGDLANLQVFEDTRGIKVGDPIELAGEMLAVTLAPGLLGMVYDGLQNPLEQLDNRQGYFLQRGESAPAVDGVALWDFEPGVKPGDEVEAGSWLGRVQERRIAHRILAPLTLRGRWRVAEIAAPGRYAVDHPIARLAGPNGREHTVTMSQRWPVKRAIRTGAHRRYPRDILPTGCRLIDTLFPLARGGTACIPGPFGAGKTVLQQLLARYAAVDVVVVIACGERAGEVVETIVEFPELVDPRTGGSLMDRTIVVCNTSSMPVAAREASVYTGITLAEYYRLMGLDVLVLADSTSRWAQALREMSGRLEEIPGEEAYPAYLESRIAGLYERAGLVELDNGATGAVTLVGTVSPAGGNFEEPVTQATLKVVGAFYGLDRKRADERRYPAIEPLSSWSLYRERMRDDDPESSARIDVAQRALQRADEVHKMMAVVGDEGVSIDDFVAYLRGELFDAAYLQQDAFDDVDAASSLERQREDLELVHRCLANDRAFADKDAARAFYAELGDALYQRRYCAVGSEEHRARTDRIERLLEAS